MAAVAHGWKPTGSASDVPVKVAKEFNEADTGRKLSKLPKRATANKYANKHPKPGAISERVYKKHGVPREESEEAER
jgi:hypothetical protein